MKVLIIRHGIAEFQSIDKSDYSRNLTTEGKAQLKSDMKQLAKFLKNKKNIEIWSSPLNRAIQSAKILSKLMELEVKEYNFIADWSDSLIENKLLENAEKTVIIFGHNPSLEFWISKMTGERISLKKGDCVQLDVDNSIKQATIDFHAEAKNYEKVLLGSKRKVKNIKKLEDIFKTKNNVIIDNLEKFQSKETNKNFDRVEDVHQLRVSIRKYRSVLNLLKDFFEEENYLKQQSDLKYSLKTMALLRELDILVEKVKSYSLENNDIENNFDKLIEKLEEIKQNEEQKTLETLKNEDYKTLINSFYEKTMSMLDSESLSNTSVEKHSLKRIEKLKKELNNRQKTISLNNWESIHEFRIVGKKLRYALEEFPSKKNRLIKSTKNLQDFLGELCDAQRNIELLEHFKNNHEDFSKFQNEISFLIKKEEEFINKFTYDDIKAILK